MKTYIVVTRDFSFDSIHTTLIEAKNSEEAWDIVEEEICTNNSQEWVLTKAQSRLLIKKLTNLLGKESQ